MKPLLSAPPDPVPKAMRVTAFVLVGYLAGVHLGLAEDRYRAARYIGAWFVLGALVLVCAAAIAVAGRRFGATGARLCWALTGTVSALMGIGFLVSHTIGLPSYHPHEWPAIQVIALPVELALLSVSVAAMARWRGRQRNG